MIHTMPAPTPLEGAGALVSTAGVDVTVDQLSDEEQAGTGRALSGPTWLGRAVDWRGVHAHVPAAGLISARRANHCLVSMIRRT